MSVPSPYPWLSRGSAATIHAIAPPLAERRGWGSAAVKHVTAPGTLRGDGGKLIGALWSGPLYHPENALSDDELLLIADKYLGDLIESIVYKYGYNVDLEDEYDELLSYITRRLVRAWFGGEKPSPKKFEAALRNARRRRRHLEVLLSYLISRYAARHGPVYLPRSSGDWRDEYH